MTGKKLKGCVAEKKISWIKITDMRITFHFFIFRDYIEQILVYLGNIIEI